MTRVIFSSDQRQARINQLDRRLQTLMTERDHIPELLSARRIAICKEINRIRANRRKIARYQPPPQRQAPNGQ